MVEAQGSIDVGHECVVLDMGECVQDANVVWDVMVGDELSELFGQGRPEEWGVDDVWQLTIGLLSYMQVAEELNSLFYVIGVIDLLDGAVAICYAK